ncbi:MAG TPA: efflux RND transporter periplasmic adaptor subunit [Steroidobacteraceae bacterium]|nr:efflux RND transporter periplasmic adaptor subunit [Steroidobacteraceae bacterium]
MDQPVTSNRTGLEGARTHSRTRTARTLVRGGAVVGVLAFVVVVWSVFAAHRASAKLKDATEAQSVVTVATTKPQPLTDLTELILPGNLQANYEAPIYARTSGYLKRWLVDIGTPVKAGQLLGEIESPEVDQQLNQAQADLATAQANQKIANVTAERWRNLRASDSVSKQEADEKISLAASNDAQVQAARANVQRLHELAGFQKIVAPFDGIVTARNTDIGQLIVAGSNTGPELFRVADMRRLRLYVRVPQTYAALMKPGLTAELIFPDRPGRTYTAKLDSTSSAIEQATRTLLAQLSVDNKSNELLPGAYSEVHFQLPVGAASAAFKLPANVLLFRGDGMHVATVGDNGQVVMKPVTLGRDYGSDIEIVQGLTAEDKVILSPPDSITEGVNVRVSPAPSGQVAKS